jgi:hypothetical protein
MYSFLLGIPLLVNPLPEITSNGNYDIQKVGFYPATYSAEFQLLNKDFYDKAIFQYKIPNNYSSKNLFK